MTALLFPGRSRAAFGVVLVLLCPWSAPLRAQQPTAEQVEPLLVGPEASPPSPGVGTAPPARPGRIRLFRITPGFLSEPLGLADDDPPADAEAPAGGDEGPDRLQFAAGNDNPYFDFRRPGDRGGIGYFRVEAQAQLFDSPSTGCALAVRAVTPAGLQFGGLDTGPTVVSPALSLFHALEDGTGVQAFLGKHMQVGGEWAAHPGQGVECGVAVHRPLLPGTRQLDSVYLFVEALGRYRCVDGGGAPATWEVLPGLHWRANERCWLTGGVLLPVGGLPAAAGPLWQLTCSFRF
jgi:hypothetical protein